MPDKTLFESDSYAIVEVMGHNVFAGRISEHIIGGAGFIRVDVPSTPEERRTQYGNEYVLPAIPGFTKIIGAASIYAITPCSEEVALTVAAKRRVAPMSVIELQPKLALAGVDDPDEDPDEDDIFQTKTRTRMTSIADPPS